MSATTIASYGRNGQKDVCFESEGSRLRRKMLEVGGPRLEATKDVAFEIEREIESKAAQEKSDCLDLCLNLSFNLLPLASNLKRSYPETVRRSPQHCQNEWFQTGLSERLTEQERCCSRIVLCYPPGPQPDDIICLLLSVGRSKKVGHVRGYWECERGDLGVRGERSEWCRGKDIDRGYPSE